jgi:hypothetical protein
LCSTYNKRLAFRLATQTMTDALPFRFRSNNHDELLAVNLIIGRGAHQAAAKMYPTSRSSCARPRG